MLGSAVPAVGLFRPMQASRLTRTAKILSVACFYAAQGCASATIAPECAPAPTAPDATTASISSTLDSMKEEYKLNAIIFGAERDGKPILRTALGVSTIGVAATTAMHFRVGAVGWQYLTAVLLRMVDENPNEIALTDRVSKWFPDYPNAESTTVRMLAASSAGFGDYITPIAFEEEVEADPLRLWTSEDLIARSVSPYQTPQFDDPGQSWMYSHTGFVVLGSILEKVSGKSYAVLLQELILDPLGLHDTRLQLDADPQQPVLHTLTESTFQDSTFWNPSFVSWAAMTSNIYDLGTWNRAFGTGALLSPESRREITSTANVGLGPNTPQVYFGLGTIVFHPWIVQRASYWGMYTTTAYDPTTGISLATTVSLSPDSPSDEAPSNAIISAVSKLLTPDHPIPND
jgi:D-alanyl-D-alanine carboxypeptidase